MPFHPLKKHLIPKWASGCKRFTCEGSWWKH